ncbi:MAG: hypothetical protein OXJ36_08475 [bacterium]|nr:hypothetical protein [bacterium]
MTTAITAEPSLRARPIPSGTASLIAGWPKPPFALHEQLATVGAFHCGAPSRIEVTGGALPGVLGQAHRSVGMDAPEIAAHQMFGDHGGDVVAAADQRQDFGGKRQECLCVNHHIGHQHPSARNRLVPR